VKRLDGMHKLFSFTLFSAVSLSLIFRKKRDLCIRHVSESKKKKLFYNIRTGSAKSIRVIFVCGVRRISRNESRTNPRYRRHRRTFRSYKRKKQVRTTDDSYEIDRFGNPRCRPGPCLVKRRAEE